MPRILEPADNLVAISDQRAGSSTALCWSLIPCFRLATQAVFETLSPPLPHSFSSFSTSEILSSKTRAPLINFCLRSPDAHVLDGIPDSSVIFLRGFEEVSLLRYFYASLCLNHCELLSSSFITRFLRKRQDAARIILWAEQECSGSLNPT